jgi:hypothetical protein
MMKKPGREKSVVHNTQHLARKATPPPGTVVSMKKLSRVRAK